MFGSSSLQGKMTGRVGTTNAHLGGLFYFEALKLYVLVYFKNPNFLNDDKLIQILFIW